MMCRAAVCSHVSFMHQITHTVLDVSCSRLTGQWPCAVKLNLQPVVCMCGLRYSGGSGCPSGQRLRDPWHREQSGGGDPLPSGERERPVWARFPSRSIHHEPEESCAGWAQVSRVAHWKGFMCQLPTGVIWWMPSAFLNVPHLFCSTKPND